MPDALTLIVRELAAPTPTLRRLVLALGDVPFSYQAGQGAALGLHGQRDRRPYSIASAPADSSADGAIEFLLRALPGGGLGRHLDGVREGTRVDFEGPFGAFVLPDVLADAPLLFVAGGTGLAPLRSLAREARARGHRGPRHLLYSVRDADDVAYAGELARWEQDHRGEAVVTATRHAPPTGRDRAAGSAWRCCAASRRRAALLPVRPAGDGGGPDARLVATRRARRSRADGAVGADRVVHAQCRSSQVQKGRGEFHSTPP